MSRAATSIPAPALPAIWVGAKARGFSVNVPLLPYTDDQIFLWAFDAVVPPLVERFAPDVIVAPTGR